MLVKTADLTYWCNEESSCSGVDAYPNVATIEVIYTDGSKREIVSELSSFNDIPWKYDKYIATLTFTIEMTGRETISEALLIEEIFAWQGFSLNSKITSITGCDPSYDCLKLGES